MKYLCIKESPDYGDDGEVDMCRCIEGYIYDVRKIIDTKFGKMLVISREWHLAECFEEIHD
jgi:hypothetical protein